jgi:casein kinase 1
MEIKIAGKYRLTKKIGSGAYGDIYQALNIKSNEKVAVKMEIVASKTPSV